MLYQGGFMGMINPEYKKKETIECIRQLFQKKAEIQAVQLQSFFQPNTYAMLKKQMKSLNYTLDHQPLRHHYNKATLNIIIKKIFKHKEFLAMIKIITKNTFKPRSSSALLLSWKDYEILHDTLREQKGIELVFDATDAWREDAGGNIVYKSDASSLTIPSKPNTLTIIKKTKSIKRFIQYINHKAKSDKKYLLIFSKVI